MKIQRSTETLHPSLVKCIRRISTNIIDLHNVPIRLFETGRDHERHAMLLGKGKTKDVVSRHLYNLENDPPLYATAVDYVFYDEKWSWNLRNSTVSAWYILFGNMVLDICPELEWAGQNRRSVNYCHFQLRYNHMLSQIDNIPCVMPPS